MNICTIWFVLEFFASVFFLFLTTPLKTVIIENVKIHTFGYLLKSFPGRERKCVYVRAHACIRARV